jgi:signal transduction histidine kinase/ActR/RegA family two-component response regulator/HPt (histidine-containing phosphotransfer) domain-containing protein
MSGNSFMRLILAAFITGSLVLILIQLSSERNIRDLVKANEKLLVELDADNKLRQAERDIISYESRIRGAVAINDTAFLGGSDDQIAEAETYLESLGAALKGDSLQKDINKLIGLAKQKRLMKKEVLDSFRVAGKFSGTVLLNSPHAKRDFDAVNIATREIYNNRQRLVTELANSMDESGRKAERWGSILIMLVLLGGAGACWFIINRANSQQSLIRRLDASEKKVRETAMVKENFMANMSHEIRTPLNAILGFTNLLKARDLKPELAEFVESIHQSGENLLIIVNDILDLSKIEAGMVRIESAPFSVRGLIHSIETMFREKSREKHLQFVTIVEDTVPDILQGDATRLTQILMNLIGNAAKFTPIGSITVRIDSRPVQENTIHLRCTIRDTGIGIAKDKISGIFDRFQQAEDSITRRYGGTGLGLYIVKDLVQLQHGEISVESEPGKGTTFSFYIPYAISTDHSSPGIPVAWTSLSEASRSDIHILVVEDNEMNQSLLRHLLSDWRLSFEMVGSGIEAIEALGKNKYTLILMDIQMPGMDGYTATRQIRQQLKLDLPIIAMTAHALAGEREKCLAHGLNEYLSKPIQERDLYRIIVQFGGAIVNPEAPVRSSDPGEGPATGTGARSAYQFINLDYMREISSGNTEYERTVTGQFLDGIPDNLQALSSALAGNDIGLLRSTAHNMKTSVSIMGLTDKLQSHLDILEYGSQVDEALGTHISAIKMICTNALQEARHFYSTL